MCFLFSTSVLARNAGSGYGLVFREKARVSVGRYTTSTLKHKIISRCRLSAVESEPSGEAELVPANRSQTIQKHPRLEPLPLRATEPEGKD